MKAEKHRAPGECPTCFELTEGMCSACTEQARYGGQDGGRKASKSPEESGIPNKVNRSSGADMDLLESCDYWECEFDCLAPRARTPTQAHGGKKLMPGSPMSGSSGGLGFEEDEEMDEMEAAASGLEFALIGDHDERKKLWQVLRAEYAVLLKQQAALSRKRFNIDYDQDDLYYFEKRIATAESEIGVLLGDMRATVQVAFLKADIDDDGYLSGEEVCDLFELIGGLNAKQTDRLVKAFRHADLDRDGRLSFEEFIDWVFRDFH